MGIIGSILLVFLALCVGLWLLGGLLCMLIVLFVFMRGK